MLIQAATVTGKPLTIGLNREYLLTALKFNLNEIQIEDALTPVVCVTGGKRLVIMPVKMEGPPSTVAKPGPVSETSTTTTPEPASTPAETRKTQMNAKPTEPSALEKVESLKAKLRELLGELNHPPRDGGPPFTNGRFKTGQSAHRVGP